MHYKFASKLTAVSNNLVVTNFANILFAKINLLIFWLKDLLLHSAIIRNTVHTAGLQTKLEGEGGRVC